MNNSTTYKNSIYERFIVFDGTDKTGKSTIFPILGDHLRAKNYRLLFIHPANVDEQNHYFDSNPDMQNLYKSDPIFASKYDQYVTILQMGRSGLEKAHGFLLSGDLHYTDSFALMMFGVHAAALSLIHYVHETYPDFFIIEDRGLLSFIIYQFHTYKCDGGWIKSMIHFLLRVYPKHYFVFTFKEAEGLKVRFAGPENDSCDLHHDLDGSIMRNSVFTQYGKDDSWCPTFIDSTKTKVHCVHVDKYNLREGDDLEKTISANSLKLFEEVLSLLDF